MLTLQWGQWIALLEQGHIPIFCEWAGYVRYEDLVEGISMQGQIDKQSGQTELFVKQHQGELLILCRSPQPGADRHLFSANRSGAVGR